MQYVTSILPNFIFSLRFNTASFFTCFREHIAVIECISVESAMLWTYKNNYVRSCTHIIHIFFKLIILWNLFETRILLAFSHISEFPFVIFLVPPEWCRCTFQHLHHALFFLTEKISPQKISLTLNFATINKYNY